MSTSTQFLINADTIKSRINGIIPKTTSSYSFVGQLLSCDHHISQYAKFVYYA